jgi:hypothetical protein
VHASVRAGEGARRTALSETTILRSLELAANPTLQAVGKHMSANNYSVASVRGAPHNVIQCRLQPKSYLLYGLSR